MNDSSPRWRRTPGRRPGQILEAATQRFAEHGYDETTTRDIAATAGVSVGTLYRYFSSKEHLLEAIHHRFHDGLEEAFDGAAEQLAALASAGTVPDVATAVDLLIEATVDFMTTQRAECRVIATHVPRVQDPEEREAHDRRFVDRMAALLQAGVEVGVIETTDPEMTAHLLYHAVRHGLTRSLAFADPPDPDRLVAQIKELFAKTLAPHDAG